MKFNDFLRLVPTFQMAMDPPDEGYRIVVPLADIIDALERNDLEICMKSERK